MRYLRLFALSALILASCSPATDSLQTTSAPKTIAAPDKGSPIEIGHTFTLTSDVLKMERRIAVRLPLGYHESENKTAYPVVYVVDGGPEQDFPHIAGITQSRDMNWTFAPFILIGIETVNRRHQIVPPATDVAAYEAELGAKPGGSTKFREFIASELMPWVDSRYRTNGRDVIMGESLGGLFVVETLFEAPTLFDDYIAVTPSLWWEEMKYGREAQEYLARLPSGKRRLIITSADEGYRHQGGIDMLIKALEAGAPETLKWRYHARGATETHGSVYHLAALEAFRDLFPMTTTYGRAGPLLSGEPLLPRTPEQDHLYESFKTSCTVGTAIQGQAEQFIGKKAVPYIYNCIALDYGTPAHAGNMDTLTEGGSIP